MSNPNTINTRRAAGFSLLEMLAVMALLLVISMTLAKLFSTSEESAQRGLGHTRSEAAVQAALSMLTADLETAVADEYLAFLLEDGIGALGVTNSRLAFASLQTAERPTGRDARLMTYGVRATAGPWGTRYDLVRQALEFSADAGTGDVHNAYWNDDWTTTTPSAAAVLVRNVAMFRVGAEGDDGRSLDYDSRDPTHDNRLPRVIDVYLEVLDERDARQVQEMQRLGVAASNITEFVESRVRRHTARAWPAHREGYRPR